VPKTDEVNGRWINFMIQTTYIRQINQGTQVEHTAQMCDIRNKHWASVENFFEQSLGTELGKLVVSFSGTSVLEELQIQLLLPEQ
jgi:hypothetical protein